MLNLYYKEQEWRPLPCWATFLHSLGHAVASGATPATVIVLTPEVAGTMPFVALGSISGLWTAADEGNRTLDEHWAMLSGLRPGTPVSYSVLRKGGNVLRHARVRLAGIRTNGELELAFRASSKESRQGLKPVIVTVKCNEEARRVTPMHVSASEFLPDLKAKEHIIPPVLGRLIGSRLHDYVSASRPDCLLLGNENRLRKECDLMLGESNATALGTIGEALRLRSDNGGTWHTLLCPLRGHTPVAEPFRLVIFDGPSTWLRHRTDYPNANHVVMAAHTSQALPELLTEVREAFREGAAPLALREQTTPLPLGMEVISFRRTA